MNPFSKVGGLFSKAAASQTGQRAASVGRVAGTVANHAAGSAFGKVTGILGVGNMVMNNPWKSGALALGVGSIVASQSDMGQLKAPHPAVQTPRPGGYGKQGASDYDLGASGDIVFALHRQR